MSKICRTSLIIMLIAMLFMSTALLCACDKVDDNGEVATTRALYYVKTEFVPDTQTANAYVMFSGGERIDDVNGEWIAHSYKINEWYNGSTTDIFVNPQAIFCAVEQMIPQEDLIYEGVQYNSLKVYLRYDTIYKSIKSDGQIRRNGRDYVHLFELDRNQTSLKVTLTTKNPNSATWYSVLVAGGIVLFVGGVLIFLATKGRLWQKTKKE